jgi:hypothetical protein
MNIEEEHDMAKDVVKTGKRTTSTSSTPDAASRLKRELMADAVGRMLGQEGEKPIPPGPSRVLLALANHQRSPGWEQAKTLQREMFEAASGGMQMKFACYGQDNANGVRRFRITNDWVNDADTMDGKMDRTACNCGCFVNIRSVLEWAAEKENVERPMRAVVISGDAFHDDQEGLDQAALAANQLRREGTRVFLIQQGDNPDTTRRLEYLQRVAGATYFKFDETQEQQYADILNCVSAYAAGGEDAVKAKGGQAATLLLEHLKQQPMEIIEQHAPVSVDREKARHRAR